MLGHSQTKERATGNPNLSLNHRATSRLYHLPDFPQPPRDLEVLGAGRRIAARMVVNEDNGGRGVLHHLTESVTG